MGTPTSALFCGGSKNAVLAAGGSGPGVNGASGRIGVHPETSRGALGLAVISGPAGDAVAGDPDGAAAMPFHLAGVGVYPPAPGGGHGPVTVTVEPWMVIVWPPGTAMISSGMVSVCLSAVMGSASGGSAGPPGKGVGWKDAGDD